MVNANHARPLAAFWLLAIAAAVIAGTGMRANDSAAPPQASPAPVSTSGAPELVLGGVLRAQTGSALTHPLAPELWAPGSATGPSGSAVQVASPSGPTTTHKARTRSSSEQGSGTGDSQPSQTTTETVSATGNGHGKGRGKQDQPAKTTSTVTATTTEPVNGGGKGRPDTAGH
jgi:hypothetical protein